MAELEGTTDGGPAVTIDLTGEDTAERDEVIVGHMPGESDGDNAQLAGAQVADSAQAGTTEEYDPIGEAEAVAAGGDEGKANEAQKEDGVEEEEGDDFDDLDSIELLEWPHPYEAECICWYPSLADVEFDEFYEMFKDNTDMDEDQMREYHRNLWYHQGHKPPLDIVKSPFWPDMEHMPGRALLSEDIYTPDEIKRLRPGRLGIKYELCTTDELKRFIFDRGLADPYPGGRMLKFYYIRVLKENDRKPSFRFMDLPPEMRNYIYGCLLRFDTSRPRACDPAILETCRQIHKEATAILYDNNIVAGVRMTRVAAALARTVEVHAEPKTLPCAHSTFLRLPQGMDDYPEFFRRIHRLEIQLTYVVVGETEDDDNALDLSHFALTLASFLADGHSLKHLKIDVDVPEWQEEWVIERMVYPLRRLRNIPNITITGGIPEYIQQKLKADISSAEPVFNTLRHWYILQEQAKTQLELLGVAGCTGCDCGTCIPSERVEEIMDGLESVGEMRRECCWNSTFEENFLARLALLKRTLQNLNVDQLKKKLETLIAQRNELKNVEAVTDDGRLEEALAVWADDPHDEERLAYTSDHDWSDESDDEQPVLTEAQPQADLQRLLSKGEIAAVMEEWEPDAASQLSRSSAPSVYDPDLSPRPSPEL